MNRKELGEREWAKETRGMPSSITVGNRGSRGGKNPDGIKKKSTCRQGLKRNKVISELLKGKFGFDTGLSR